MHGWMDKEGGNHLVCPVSVTQCSLLNPPTQTHTHTHTHTQAADEVHHAFDLCTAACLVPAQGGDSPKAHTRDERIDPGAALSDKVVVTAIYV